MPTYRVSPSSSGSVVVRVDGELVGATPPFSIPPELRQHFDADEARSMEVELSGVEVIDLEGVGFLLFLWREARRRGRPLRIRGPQGSVRAKLQQTGVLELLEGEGQSGMTASAGSTL
jgi:anti-anti-sigma factor